MNCAILNLELIGDPLERGYASMGDAEAAADLNMDYRERQLETLDGGVVYDQVDVVEFQALGAEQRQEVWDIAHLGAGIPVGPGSKARDRFVSIFGGASATLSNLQAVITIPITRGEELGLGRVKVGHVQMARSM